MGEKITAIKAISVIFMFIGCGLVSGIIGGLKFSISGIKDTVWRGTRIFAL